MITNHTNTVTNQEDVCCSSWSGGSSWSDVFWIVCHFILIYYKVGGSFPLSPCLLLPSHFESKKAQRADQSQRRNQSEAASSKSGAEQKCIISSLQPVSHLFIYICGLFYRVLSILYVAVIDSYVVFDDLYMDCSQTNTVTLLTGQKHIRVRTGTCRPS